MHQSRFVREHELSTEVYAHVDHGVAVDGGGRQRHRVHADLLQGLEIVELAVALRDRVSSHIAGDAGLADPELQLLACFVRGLGAYQGIGFEGCEDGALRRVSSAQVQDLQGVHPRL
jgi:hypothetical protein